MRKYNTLIDELIKLHNLIGIDDVNRSRVVLKSNELLRRMLKSEKNKWRLKTKIIIFIVMTMVGTKHEKNTAVLRLKEILEENQELFDYSLEISQKLKMVALAS